MSFDARSLSRQLSHSRSQAEAYKADVQYLGEQRSSFNAPSQSRFVDRRTTSLWSRVPLHLLRPTAAALGARLYSSNSRQDGEEADQSQESPSATENISPLSSDPPGFQSLSALFQGSSQGRYSSSRISRSKEGLHPNSAEPGPKTSDRTAVRDFFESSEPSARAHSGVRPVPLPRFTDSVTVGSGDLGETGNSSKPSIGHSGEGQSAQTDSIGPRLLKHVAKEAPTPASRPVGSTQRSKAALRDHNRAKGQIGAASARSDDEPKSRRNRIRTKAWRDTSGTRRRPNPFASPAKSQPEKRTRQTTSHTSSTGPERPWGLSTDQHKSGTPNLMPQGPANDAESSNNAYKTSSPNTSINVPSDHKLTHVKSSGEAHMVDVGAKQSTKRVAIAVANVRFKNSLPQGLISENSNKKGDVFGVARIAGIMAAKRTSDLIPLCHPIAVSKVDVEIRLLSSDTPSFVKRITENGAAEIIAHVECTGQTGVEMEAMTAASVAALTVYDMCKAVDRHMICGQTSVVYKSGGKSGTHVAGFFVQAVGPEFFTKRGLQLPRSLEWTRDDSESPTSRE